MKSENKNTINVFDHWNAEDYSNHSGMQYDYAMKILKKYTFQRDDCILDVGCGDGKISVLMAKEVPQGRVVGVDNSFSMIEHAKRFEKEQPNVTFMQKNAEQLNFSEEFDWMTSFSCFHWIENQRAVWEGIHKALKPMGHAAVLFYKKHPDLWKAIEKTIKHPEWSAFFQHYQPPVHWPFCELSQKDYAHLLTQCGFRVDFMEDETCFYFFENKHALETFVAAWLPHLSKIPASKQQVFMKQFCDNYFDIVPVESGVAKMSFTHRIFVVSKLN